MFLSPCLPRRSRTTGTAEEGKIKKVKGKRVSLSSFCLFTSVLIFGGQGRNRTADAGLFRAALYQLSYLAWCFPIAVRKERSIRRPHL